MKQSVTRMKAKQACHAITKQRGQWSEVKEEGERETFKRDLGFCHQGQDQSYSCSRTQARTVTDCLI